MTRLFLFLLLTAAAIAAAPGHSRAAATVTRIVHSDVLNGDVAITCNAGPITTDYAAETGSGVPLNGPYAVLRGADKGLVHLMNHNGRRTKRYVIPHRLIRAIVSVKFGLTERADLVFGPRRLTLVHTYITNAGIFTASDVYELPLGRDGHVDTTLIKPDQDASALFTLGLPAYQAAHGTCSPVVK
jgi:hypothetical protein